MTGLEYERLKCNMTQEDLAASAGLGAITVRRIEKGHTKNPIASTLLCFADVLHCSIADLCKEYPDHDTRSRVGKETSIVNSSNVLLAYKLATHCTFRELGSILHLTNEGVRVACKRVPAHEQYVELLAAHEGMRVEDFLSEYLAEGLE